MRRTQTMRRKMMEPTTIHERRSIVELTPGTGQERSKPSESKEEKKTRRALEIERAAEQVQHCG
jgi:hypothetical protein